jgi:hypothetical protein
MTPDRRRIVAKSKPSPPAAGGTDGPPPSAEQTMKMLALLALVLGAASQASAAETVTAAPASGAATRPALGSCSYTSDEAKDKGLTFCTRTTDEARCAAAAAAKVSPEHLAKHPAHFKAGGSCGDLEAARAAAQKKASRKTAGATPAASGH